MHGLGEIVRANLARGELFGTRDLGDGYKRPHAIGYNGEGSPWLVEHARHDFVVRRVHDGQILSRHTKLRQARKAVADLIRKA